MAEAELAAEMLAQLIEEVRYTLNSTIVTVLLSFVSMSCSAVMRLHVVCPSVCLSVTFRFRDHIDWNTSKIISRPNSLKAYARADPSMDDLIQQEHPQN